MEIVSDETRDFQLRHESSLEMHQDATYHETMLKNNKFLASVLALLLFPISALLAQGNAYNHPAAQGEPVNSVVQIGPMNTSNYDVVITLLETLRGKQALQRLQTADAAIKSPMKGFEFLLARIRFELQGRAPSDQGTFVLGSSPFQWVANSAEFRQYDSTSATPPNPVLQGPVRAGETAEGWLVFQVEQGESKPVLTFDPSSGGATGRGNILFFQLY